MRSQCVSVRKSLSGYDDVVAPHHCHDVLEFSIGEHAHVYVLHYQGLGTNTSKSIQMNKKNAVINSQFLFIGETGSLSFSNINANYLSVANSCENNQTIFQRKTQRGVRQSVPEYKNTNYYSAI